MADALEIIGTLVGLVYLWLEYKASVYLWIAGIIMPAIYLVVYYEAGLYADFGINVYYLVVSVYGWMMWRYGNFIRHRLLHQADASPDSAASAASATEREVVLPITHVPTRTLLPLAAVFALTFVGIAWILISFTDSNVPWLDSFTTAMSIVGMWMLAQKYVEQWWAWILVDVVSCGLYIYKGLEFTAALYGLYAVIAVFGYFKWKREM